MNILIMSDDEYYPALPGAANANGPRYESLMASFVSLKLLQDSTIADFKISNNNNVTFGKFDDVVVEATSKDGKKLTWAIQLKHSNSGKAISKNELAASSGEFSVQKYFEDYIALRQQNTGEQLDKSENTLILYTNRRLDDEKQFEKTVGNRSYIFKTSKVNKTSFFDLTSSRNSSIYQFGIEEEHDRNELEEYKQFFSKFYIYSNQSDADGIDREISKLFNDIYKSDVADKYKKYFEVWSRIGGIKKKVSKTDLELELSKILLEQHVVPISPMESDDRGEMLKQAISNYNVTVLPQDCRELIKNLWKISDSVQDWNDSGDVPLVVNVDVDNHHAVCSAINLRPNPKFVLIGDCVDLTKLKHLKVFENLRDLQGECYSKVVANFSCVIQGRSETRLVEILNDNESLKQYFGVGELFKMVDKEPLVIGDETVLLPEYYIKRSIPKPHVFSLDLVKNLIRNDVLVVACDDGSVWNAVQNLSAKVLRKEDNDFEKNLTDSYFDEKPLIILSKNTFCTEKFYEICNKINGRKSVHHFQFDNEDLVWIRTHGVVYYLKTLQTVVSNETVADSNFLQYFVNNINVILADPGMGKSVFGNFLKRISKFDYWPLLINLRENVSIFHNHAKNGREADLVERILNSESNKSVEKFRTLYKKNRKLLFIWDGLDEVETGDVQSILNGIKEISYQGYNQWITTRVHLKETLEDFFGVFSINLTEITPEDQKKYIEQSLNQTYGHNIENVTCNIFEHIEKSKLRNMLGTPLLLYMYTQICLDESKYEQMLKSELNLTGIYDMFVDGKFNHFNEKIQKESSSLFSKAQKIIKNALLHVYQKAALKTCFDHSIFEKLNLDYDDFLEDMKSGDVYGIITNVTDDTATFIHKTVAEYFSAQYLANNFKRLNRELLKCLFQEEYKTIRLFFDMCLAQNCPAHLAILELNVDKLQNNLEDVLRKDRGGRNGLHIACSYGVARPPLVLKKITSKKKYKIFGDLPLEYLEREKRDYENIIEILISHVKDDEGCVSDKDEVFDMNCLQYADISMSLFPILEIFTSNPKLYKEPGDIFLNYKDLETVITYAIIFNYEHFISILKCVPYFECTVTHFKKFKLPHLLDGVNYNILMLMVFFDRFHMLKKALENKNNIRMINVRSGESDLIRWAIEKSDLKMVKLLMQYPIKTTQPYRCYLQAILHDAVQAKKIDMVKYFVDMNLVKVNKCNASKDTPLLIASRVGNFAIAKFLISHGAYVYAQNKDGYNILHLACWGQHLEFIKSLPRKFLVKLDEADCDGNTPLLLAVFKGNFNISKHLMDNGANVYAKNKCGRNILHLACLDQRLEFIENLPRKCLVRLDEADRDGNTPLLLAARQGNFNIFKHLMDNGANVNAKNSKGHNILHCALFGGFAFVKMMTREDVVKFDNGDNHGNTPLLLAAWLGPLETFKHLFDNGANINARNSHGHDFFHLPSWMRLIKYGDKRINRMRRSNELIQMECIRYVSRKWLHFLIDQ